MKQIAVSWKYKYPYSMSIKKKMKYSKYVHNMSKYVCNMSKCMHNITNLRLLHILAYIVFRICTLKMIILKWLELSTPIFEKEMSWFF